MKWSSRQREIQRLKAKHAGERWRNILPDLSCPSRAPPCGGKFGPVIGKRMLPADAKQFPIGHTHKSGLEMITPGMMPHLSALSGKKM